MTLRTGVLTVIVGAVAIGCGGPPEAAAPSAAPVTVTVPTTATATATTAPTAAPTPVVAERPEPVTEDFIGGTTSSEEVPPAAPAVVVTDAERARAGARYASELGQFFRQRWQIPAVVSPAEAARLCVTFQLNVSPKLVIWHVRTEPTKASGNTLFDESARTMLEKLVQDRTHLPEPPPEVADLFRGRTILVRLTASQAAASSCK